MKITLGHGGGGELMGELISKVILANTTFRKVGAVGLEALDDGASITVGGKEIVLTTDAHTVTPLFFPGGDIGRLAVCGTVNDIAMMGARPVALASAFVIEEGFDTEDLERIVKSMDAAAKESGVSIIAGDLKVMERGAIDKIVITTTGVGIADEVVRDANLKVGDKIILTGTVGDHGIALMSFREGFGFETTLKSDVAPLWGMIKLALEAGGISAMKDPTRGGLAAALNDWAKKNNLGILAQEARIPLKKEVVAASEMLGLDPYQVANEGKAIIAVSADKADEVLKIIKSTELGKDAQIIGEVTKERPCKVILETIVGGKRIMEPPIGDPVPRVC
ncbi:hydrogenase expression/formation protein HypE [archaeon]|nr:hydrogenase expression/formation protein HypE [archaeon]